MNIIAHATLSMTYELLYHRILKFVFLQDILPSDDPDTTKGSSLFGTRSPLPSVTVNDATPAASLSRKTEANESHSEDTETESEWEKERAQKKAQRDEEIERVS